MISSSTEKTRVKSGGQVSREAVARLEVIHRHEVNWRLRASDDCRRSSVKADEKHVQACEQGTSRQNPCCRRSFCASARC